MTPVEPLDRLTFEERRTLQNRAGLFLDGPARTSKEQATMNTETTQTTQKTPRNEKAAKTLEDYLDELREVARASHRQTFAQAAQEAAAKTAIYAPAALVVLSAAMLIGKKIFVPTSPM